MSGDTQPKKRKDKKRKKDDEDTVKETTVHHAAKQASGGAAQAAKDPSDVQMHVHSDHGTGGHWCAKIVFFILLAGLGALIGLIIMENRGVSNDDTPLSESRYSEFFNGWVDETRQDDHHHEEILAAINSLDDHDDHDEQDGGAEHDAVDDHDDEHDQDGDDGDDDHDDDGAPYAEQEDHDDEDDDDEPVQKLDDDEVEEIFAQQEATARQEAFAQAERDDGDDQDDDGDDQADDDEDDADDEEDNGATNNPNIAHDDDNDADDGDDDNVDDKQNEETDKDDDDDDDDDADNTIDNDDNDEDDQISEYENVVTKTGPEITDGQAEDDDGDDDEVNIDSQVEDDNDDDDDDDDEDVEVKGEFAAEEKQTNAANDEEDDDDDDNEDENDEPVVRVVHENDNADHDDDDGEDDDVDAIAEEIDEIVRAEDDQDETVFDEAKLPPNALNARLNENMAQAVQDEDVPKRDLVEKIVNIGVPEAGDLQTEQKQETTDPPQSEEPVTGETLKNQMDELVKNFNKLAESLDVPLVQETADAEEHVEVQPSGKDVDDDDDEDEIEEVKRGSEQLNGEEDDADDDGNDDDFNDFVDNDGGEEEYLAKLRSEQLRRTAAEEERKAAVEPEEETSQKASATDDAKKTQTATVSTSSSTSYSPRPGQTEARPFVPTNTGSVVDDFIYAGSAQQLSNERVDVIEENVIILDDTDEAERYSGDEYDYEMEDLEEELEEVEAEEDVDETQLIKQEQEIGAFVPITFEDFNSMYRPPPEMGELLAEEQQEQQLLEQQLQRQQQQQLQPHEAHFEAHDPSDQHVAKKVAKESLLARKKPPKGAVNKLIYGLHKDPIVIRTDVEADPTTTTATATMATAETVTNVSAKGEARSVLTALLSEIPSPPPIDLDHEFDKLVPTEPPTIVRPPVDTGSLQRHAGVSMDGKYENMSALPASREKHVEFLLPERESSFELEPEPLSDHLMEWSIPASDNGSKENLFVPDASEEEMESDDYAEEYALYEGGDEEGELIYEDEEEEELDDIDSVLLNQYGSDEEEEPLTDDNIPPGGDDDEASDVDDSDLMRRLEAKYGKLPAAPAGTTIPATAATSSEAAAAASPDGDDDEATAAGWTKIPTRAEEADRSYQEELRRAQQQLDEKQAQEAVASFERLIARRSNSIVALVGRARALDALAEQQRSNTILTEAIAAYRKVIGHELAVDDVTLKTVAERCIDRLRFQGQHAKAIDIHEMLIRRFDDEPHYRNQLAVTYLYMNRLAEAKAVLHETLLRWIEDGFALVHYGFVLKTHDQNMEQAAQYLREGIETGHEGTQDGRFYFQLGDALQRLGRNQEALDVYRKGVQQKLFLSVYQRSLYNVDGLRSRPFWTVEQTTYATELERVRTQWMLIRDEGLKLLNANGVFVNESENLRDRGDWKQLELFSRGVRMERNCARAPVTCRLVEQHLPAARTCKRGQVKFSVMHPGTHVWPHCGPTNCRIRAHLGLSVPDGTHIRVAEETRSWENGQWLIFDDSFEHEVWHNGTTTRLVLIVDLWHPDLTESQRRSLSPL